MEPMLITHHAPVLITVAWTLITASATFEHSDPNLTHSSQTLGCFFSWREQTFETRTFLSCNSCIIVIASVLFIGFNLPECKCHRQTATKKILETFYKVTLDKPSRSNVYEQFHPMKIIKSHIIPPKNFAPGDHFVRWEINKWKGINPENVFN